jgi:hypothetical protein
MKIILTGCTGFIGSEILTQCLAHPFITHIYILTRRPHPDAKFSHKKISQLLHEDFESYPQALLDRLRDERVEACIWALGDKPGKTPAAAVAAAAAAAPVEATNTPSTLEEAHKVGITYPISAAEAFASSLAPGLAPYVGYPGKLGPGVGEGGFPFRFVFVSAWGAEQDQFRKLWVGGEFRKIKGAAEKGIFEVAENSALVAGKDGGKHRCFEAVALRPGKVLEKGDAIGTVVREAVAAGCTVDRLAACAIRVAMFGAEGKRVVENRECLGEGWTLVNTIPMVR